MIDIDSIGCFGGVGMGVGVGARTNHFGIPGHKGLSEGHAVVVGVYATLGFATSVVVVVIFSAVAIGVVDIGTTAVIFPSGTIIANTVVFEGQEAVLVIIDDFLACREVETVEIVPYFLSQQTIGV